MSEDRWPGDGVRPTKRCFREDLNLEIPTLDVCLEDLEHPLLSKAQQLPDVVESGGGERISAIDDRRWLKVKTGAWRGAATELKDQPELLGGVPASWWLGAAGVRREDSPQDDFYATLARTTAAAAKVAVQAQATYPFTACSDELLPTSWDFRRVVAERAARFVGVVRRRVRSMALDSMMSGKVVVATFDSWELQVCIRADGPTDAEAYIVVSGAGLTDPKLFAVIFDSIPGIPPEDWMPEPSSSLNIQPNSGHVVYSALLSPTVQTALLEDGAGGTP